MKQNYEHIPVLLKEVLQYLDPKPGQSFVDATLGGGGYTTAILEKVQPDGKVLAVDMDQDAVENFKDQIFPLRGITQRVTNSWGAGAVVVHGNFGQIDKIVHHHNFQNIQGIVADIGLSSYQLDQSERGISFQKNEPLDMRFDRSQNLRNAKLIINTYTQEELAKIFREYGEEPFTKQIVKKILDKRSEHEIKTTTEVFDLIREGLPKPVKHKASDSARRIFQALRIEVNQELQNLEEFLPKAFSLLVPGGRLVVVSFHSLEDRIVKQYFNGLSKGCVCPIDFPQCICGKSPQGKVLTKKPVTAGEHELRQNSRSKPAKLRVVQKL